MLSPHCARVEITLAGVPHRLACTLLAWATFEERTGRAMFDCPSLTIETAITLTWALLVTEHPDIEEAHVGAASPAEFQAAIEAAVKLSADMQPVPDPDAEEAPAKADDDSGRMNWRRLWAVGRYDMGLSDAEFWSLAPWQLFELHARYQADRDEYFLGQGMVCAAVTNCHIDCEKTAPLQAAEFMPGKIGDKARKLRDKEQQAGLKGKLGHFAQAFGAKVIKKPAPTAVPTPAPKKRK